jgi:hypothetical protein
MLLTDHLNSNIEKIVLRAYQWLSNKYEESDSSADQIYLFGA